jgi:hypothetical protein
MLSAAWSARSQRLDFEAFCAIGISTEIRPPVVGDAASLRHDTAINVIYNTWQHE